MCPYEHSISVIDRGGNYRYVATCECGWRSIGYVSIHAALMVGDAHVEAGGVA